MGHPTSTETADIPDSTNQGGSPLTPCESKIPTDQPTSVRHEATFYPTPPNGYSAAIGWVNATIGNGGSVGKVNTTSLKQVDVLLGTRQ